MKRPSNTTNKKHGFYKQPVQQTKNNNRGTIKKYALIPGPQAAAGMMVIGAINPDSMAAHQVNEQQKPVLFLFFV